MKNREIIREWYEKNRRDLPWRSASDPYRILLSEVILQQTRISQGINYYHRFLETFPDVKALAEAEEEQVLKVWQGLGYYSRARNLHQAAGQIVRQFGGKLPGNYNHLLGLKGVGPYTAAAIASICFGEPRAVVDGNVARVLSRLYGVEDAVNSTAGARSIARLADELLDRDDPGTHNQAIMEFGALQCIPSKPDCPACPLNASCIALHTGRVERLPVKNRGRKPVERWMYFYIIRCGREIILTRRGTDDIWGGLYQFPLVESGTELGDEEILRRLQTLLNGNHPGPVVPSGAAPVLPGPGHPERTIEKISRTIRHQLTHRSLRARFIHVTIDRWPEPLPAEWTKISSGRLDDFPVPRLINRYMEVVRNSYL